MIMETTVNTDLVIFDLDGTLLDTIGDLAVACNAVLALRGLPQHSYEEYCHFVGNGIMRLVERALPEELRTPYTVAAVRADFVKYYTEHIDAYTKPYDGIPELVAGLVRRGVRIAVASNKFQAGTEKLVRLFFPDVPFAAVFGQREGVPLKPDPAVVEEILSLTGAAKGAGALRRRFGRGHADCRGCGRTLGGRHVGFQKTRGAGRVGRRAYRRPACGDSRPAVIGQFGSKKRQPVRKGRLSLFQQ